MTTPQLIIQAISGMSLIGAALGGGIMLAEAYAKAASRRWWRDRDPMWVDPFPAGASAANAGCSASLPTTGRSPLGKAAASFEASHPTATPPSVATVTTSRSPAGTLVRGLILSRSIQ